MNTDHIPDDWTIEERNGRTYCYDADGVPRCGAKKRTTGDPCRIRPTPNGNGRCTRFHNGDAPMGVAHPAYKHGRNSRIRNQLPKRLQEIYDNEQDDDLHNIDPNIMLVSTRLLELLGRIQQGDYAASYKALLNTYNAGDRALSEPDMMQFAIEWRALGRLIKQGAADYRLWDDILRLNDEHAKLVDRKVSILQKSQHSISIDEFIFVMSRLEVTLTRAMDLPDPSHRKQAVANAIRSLAAYDTE